MWQVVHTHVSLICHQAVYYDIGVKAGEVAAGYGLPSIMLGCVPTGGSRPVKQRWAVEHRTLALHSQCMQLCWQLYLIFFKSTSCTKQFIRKHKHLSVWVAPDRLFHNWPIVTLWPYSYLIPYDSLLVLDSNRLTCLCIWEQCPRNCKFSLFRTVTCIHWASN